MTRLDDGLAPAPVARLLGFAAAALVAGVTVWALPDAPAYALDVLAGRPGKPVSMVVILAAVLAPVALGVRYAGSRPGWGVALASVPVGLAFGLYGVRTLVELRSRCDTPPGLSAHCLQPPWWQLSVPAGVAYLLGGAGLAVAGLVLIRSVR